MSEEEKKAIEKLKLFEYKYTLKHNDDKAIEVVLNYISKLQKEIDKIRQVEIEVIKENTMFGEKIDEQSRIIDKLQKENKNADERNYSLGLEFIQIGEKLGLENFGIQTILLGIEKLQKENEELKKTLKQTQDSWFKDTERLNKLQKEKEEYRIGWCNEGRKCEKLLEELNNRTPNW